VLISVLYAHTSTTRLLRVPSNLMPLTHPPEIGAVNSTPDFFGADARLLTALTASGSPKKSTTLEVAHRRVKLAPESAVEFGHTALISRACVRGLIRVHRYCNRSYLLCSAY